MVFGWIIAIAFVILVLFAFDRYLLVKEIETDLKEYLGDVQVARDAADPSIRVHFSAQVFALKHLIRKHFKL